MMKLVFPFLLIAVYNTGCTKHPQCAVVSPCERYSSVPLKDEPLVISNGSDSTFNKIEMFLSKQYLQQTVRQVNLTIRNNTSCLCWTGYEYSIERKEGRKWIKIPLKNGAFDELALGIGPHNNRDFVIDLSNVKHVYHKGIYHIRNNLRIETKDGFCNKDIYCCFNIID